MQYELNVLANNETGAEIKGLDLRQPLDAQTRAELNAALGRYGVLVFRDQQLTPDQLKQAGEIFGEIMRHHRRTSEISGNPWVSQVRNEPVVSATGKPMIQGESFHTDHSNDPVPPKATALHTVALPSKGGDTQYVNVHQAYDDLTDSAKHRLAGLKARHVYQSKYSPREIRKLDDESLKNIPPPAIHPLVRTHPETGRKYLYLNPVRIESIIGMPDDEAQELIKQLMAHATQSKYEYRHKWVMGDMVIWDNRCVMHKANPDYDMRELRHLIRIMVHGALAADEMTVANVAH